MITSPVPVGVIDRYYNNQLPVRILCIFLNLSTGEVTEGKEINVGALIPGKYVHM